MFKLVHYNNLYKTKRSPIMNLHNIISVATKEFKQNLIDFCQNRDFSRLSPDIALEFCDGLQSSLASTGRVAFRTFIEAFESKHNTVKKENKSYRYKTVSRKKFLTPFGELTIPRRLYQAEQSNKYFIPLDEIWGMTDEYATIDVRESICFSCGLITPEETSTLLKKSALFHPSATAIKHIVAKTGEFSEENKGEIDNTIRKEEIIPVKTKAISISLDGVNVLLNEPGIRKGRKIQRPKLGYQNNDKTSFRNAMVGSLSFYTSEKDFPKRIESRYVSQMPEPNFLTFRGHFEDEVKSVFEKLPEKVKIVLIVDGHHSIRGYLRNHELFKGCIYLIDYYHVIEHLSKASEAIFGKSTEKNKVWYTKWKKILKTETWGVEKLYRSLKYYKGVISKSQQKLLMPEINYFKKHKHHMNYAYNVSQGLPIGSGPVEAACKSIVKTRMCRSGMRWSRTGGQKILNFRTYIKSNRWESFWKQYKEWKLAA